MRKEITVVGYMILPEGGTVPMEALTPAQRAEFRARAAARLSDRMGAYYAQHPEEFDRLPD